MGAVGPMFSGCLDFAVGCAAVSGAVMVAVLVALARALPEAPALRMSVLVAAGAAAYFATLWLTHRETIKGALALLRRE